MRIQHSYLLPLLPLLFVLGACSKDNTPAATPPANGTTAAAANAEPLPAAAAAATLNFPTYGFQINSFDTPTRSAIQALAMYLPLTPAPTTAPGAKPAPQMASYVNVQVVQPYTETIATYTANSMTEFTKLKFTVLKQSNPTPNEWIIEYTGLVQDIALRFYAHAILINNKIVLATGISLDSQWLECADKIRSCVDSLALAGPAASGLTMPNYGFHINPLETTLSTNPIPVQPLIMFMPANGGSPSVNIQIQPLKKGNSMAEYISQSKADMQKSADNFFAINGEQTPNANEWILEYMGVVQNQAAHFIAHAIWANNRVYLATGFVPDGLWAEFGDRLKACVLSFKVTGTTPFPVVVWPAEPAPATTAAPADTASAMSLTNGSTTVPAAGTATAPTAGTAH